jgi:hypothetical protein
MRANLFGAFDVFREGAENCARGGRAPISIMVFGLNRVNRCNGSTINFHQLTGTVIFFPKRL